MRYTLRVITTLVMLGSGTAHAQDVPWLDCADPRVVAAQPFMGCVGEEEYQSMRVRIGEWPNVPLCRSPYDHEPSCYSPQRLYALPARFTTGVEYIGAFGFAMTVHGAIINLMGDVIYICEITQSGGAPEVGRFFGHAQWRGPGMWCYGDPTVPGCATNFSGDPNGHSHEQPHRDDR